MLSCQKAAFSLPEQVTYLNGAYLSPQLKSVEQAGLKAVTRKSFPFELQISDFFEPVEQLKALYARFINTPDKDRIAIIPSVSYGMANVANNIRLQSGDRIVMALEQFPSNFYSWKKLADHSGASLHVVPPPASDARTQAWNEAILDAINEQTKLVAIANVHWADGTLFDLMAIRQKTNQFGAMLVIDGTQSVGALPIDVDALQPDALICAGYKWLLGPYAIGLAYYGPRFDDGIPIEENWINRLNSDNFKELVNYQPLYKPKANRYSMGEQSNFILIPMLQKALEQLLDWGASNIQTYCKTISKDAVTVLKEMGCQIEDEAARCGHLFGVRLDNAWFDFEKLSHLFAAEQVYVSVRGNAIRISPNVYNEERDFEKLISCFEKARKKVFV